MDEFMPDQKEESEPLMEAIPNEEPEQMEGAGS